MATLTTTQVLHVRYVAALLAPRDDFVVAESTISTQTTPTSPRATQDEGSAEHHTFTLEHGPFDRYERVVEIHPGPEPDTKRVTQRTDFRVAAPVWRILLTLPVKKALRDRHSPGTSAWWAPPDRFDATTARAISLLCLAMIVTGYLGSIIGQTATFASDEFGTSDRAQGFLFAAVRLGTLLTLVITTLADRKGRRRLLIFALATGSLMTMAGALSTGIWSLGGTQAVSRGMATAISLLVGIMAAEATPQNSRAYTASVLSLTAGLGAGMVVWVLPVADLGIRAWRMIYLVPVLALPLTIWMARHLQESARFQEYQASGSDDPNALIKRRLLLVAAVSFLILLFAAPASQFRNDFLRDERGFSAAQVSLFVLATNTPVGIGVAIAGKMADRRGRRPIAALAVGGGALLTVATYAVAGWGMWVASVFASIIGAMAAPALGVYSAEMFGTARRGRANGIVSLIGLAGSAIGLLTVGVLVDQLDSYAAAFSIMAIGPALVVLLVLTQFPETAHRSLEELNPTSGPSPPAPNSS